MRNSEKRNEISILILKRNAFWCLVFLFFKSSWRKNIENFTFIQFYSFEDFKMEAKIHFTNKKFRRIFQIRNFVLSKYSCHTRFMDAFPAMRCMLTVMKGLKTFLWSKVSWWMFFLRPFQPKFLVYFIKLLIHSLFS